MSATPVLGVLVDFGHAGNCTMKSLELEVCNLKVNNTRIKTQKVIDGVSMFHVLGRGRCPNTAKIKTDLKTKIKSPLPLDPVSPAGISRFALDCWRAICFSCFLRAVVVEICDLPFIFKLPQKKDMANQSNKLEQNILL